MVTDIKEKRKATGRFSKQAIDDMQNPNISIEDIAITYNKTPEAVARKRAELSVTPKSISEDEEVLHRLHLSYFWPTVKKLLFPPHEVEFFEKEWIHLHNQFSSQGVLHTDEIMMKDLTLHEIMAYRAAEQKKRNMAEIDSIQRKINNEMKKPERTRDDLGIANWDMQKSNLQSLVASLTKEHLDYQKKKDDKLEQLKATRSQRLKQAEMAGKNIWEMLKELDRPEMRRKYGKYMQKMKIASDTIRLEWGNSLEYEDGQWDQPLLSPDLEVNDNNDEKLSKN